MILKPVAIALAALLLAGACGKSFSPGTAGQAQTAGSAAPKAGGDPSQQNLSQDLLDKLKSVTGEADAAALEQEIQDAWLVSGSATVDTLMRRGLAYQQGEDLEGARQAFDLAIALKPDYAEAWNRRAVLFFNAGDYDEALKDIESALTHEPRHFGAWVGLAAIFESIEKPEAALRAYDKALAIDPFLAGAKEGKKRLERGLQGRSL